MNIYEFADKLTILSPIGLGIGIVGGIYRYLSLNKIYRLITIYLIIALLTDFASRLLSFMDQSNLILLPIFNLLELLLFLKIYYLFFEKTRKLLLLVVAVVFLAAFGSDVIPLFLDQNVMTHSYSSIIEALSIIFLAFLFFFDRIQAYNELKWTVFALNSVILVYFSVKLMFYIPINFFIHDDTNLKFYFWIVHLIMLIIFYLYLAKSIWEHGKIQEQ
ncbi:hypothetical protein [Fluviicola taffensis]|uniref:Uncharacterized protein n=1 Tax=Fluviicola taffensis (strain DSM 16823 / NCIMB 13979 / RW262) TaxID=755732 RepID=F2IK81_FLUTR|nr:hypothetical protein [Fluviicola taffensis]AEA43984.1 hypothetical protein Fluta_1998 [Fluviicola taffensis DSM 16823]